MICSIYCIYLQVTMTGDYILSIASILIARLKNDDVTIVLSEVSVNVQTHPICKYFKINEHGTIDEQAEYIQKRERQPN